MPHVNPQLLIWARETARLSRADAAEKLDIQAARGVPAVDRLRELELGERAPSRSLLLRMAKLYHRPLLAFYLAQPPNMGDRGDDFRSLPERETSAEPLVDALVRDVKGRQAMVRAILEEEEDAVTVGFVGSQTPLDGVGPLLAAMRQTLQLDLGEYRAQVSPEAAFALLRAKVEKAGVFVLLLGNLGSHHTALDVAAFRGFALADPLAPFIVINDQDAKPAWSFTLLHELAHLWLGSTGVSGGSAENRIEQFCNDVAGNFLLPEPELRALAGYLASQLDDLSDPDRLARPISDFARERHISRSMVAYRLYRADVFSYAVWQALARKFLTEWRKGREAERERARERDGGPNFYVVRRHRVGTALLHFAARTLSEGSLTPTKAARILGVKARSVGPLLSGLLSPTARQVG